MLKVTIVKSNLSYQGGLEKYSIAIAKAFAKKGCKVTILTTGSGHQEIPGIQIVSFGQSPKWGYLAVRFFDYKCQEWIQQNHSDLIFGLDRTTHLTHYRAGNGSHQIFLERKNKSFLGSLLHVLNPKDQIILKKEKTLFENPNLKVLFTNSKMVKNELLDRYKISADKIKVTYNGIDFEKFNSLLDCKEKALLALNLDPKKKTLLFIGNGYGRKGLLFLLKSLSHLEDKAFQVLVIGKEKRLLSYKKYAQKLGLSQQIHFLGPQKNLIPFYQVADIFVLPTHYDPFAGVTLEALSMGLYVITSPFNGAKEIIQKGCGYVLPDLKNSAPLTAVLKQAMEGSLQTLSKTEIRESIKGLSIENQLNHIVEQSLSYVS